MKGRLWAGYVAAASLVATGYFLVPRSDLTHLLLYNGIGLSAVVAVLFGIRRNRPADRRPWLLIVAGQASFLTADICYYILESLADEAPFPSVADLFYLGMYPLVIMGLLRLVAQTSPGRDWSSLVDAAIVAVATFAAFGVLVMDRYLADPNLTLAGRVISVCYPVMDVALIAVAARLMGLVHLRRPAFGLLLAGLCSLLVADLIYGILNSAGVFETGGVADVFWLGFYILLAAAALHPDMAEPPTERDLGLSMTHSGIAVLTLTTLMVPAIDLLWGQPVDKLLTTVCSSLLFLLVIVRLVTLVGVIQKNEKQARHDSMHDALTGLGNRVLFSRRVNEFGRSRSAGIIAVLFIDLDDFKTVNDSLGHERGDQLLQLVAERLLASVRDEDLVARLSGDEFAILVESAVDRQDAVAAARRVQEALSGHVMLGDRSVTLSASVGITVEDAENFRDADDLLRAADAAMYHAKASGKGRFEFFAQEMRSEAVERLELKADLQVALAQGEFEVYYQPIVRLTDRRIVSVEALLRWHHPTRGLITPSKFIPLAEQTGLVTSIGAWTLQQACHQVARWQRLYPGSAPQRVSVNLSVMQLHDPGLVDFVTDALAQSGLDPSALTLEITESMLLAKTRQTTTTLEALKGLQVKIAIDDFGTGYSALSYLRHFPVDVIKIDRSFVQELAVSSTSRSLVAAVVDLARRLEIDTVAEGIEDEAQFTELLGMGCIGGQGYLFSIPLPARRAEALFAPTRGATRTTPVSTAALEVQLVAGVHDLDGIASDLELLHSDLGKPLMSTWTWLRPWTSVHRDWDPMAVIVRERNGYRIEAAALLAQQVVDGVHHVIAIGRGPLQCTRLASRSDRGARMLARGIIDALPSGGRWRLDMPELPEGDRVARILAQQLPGAEISQLMPIPRVDFADYRSGDNLLSTNMRRQLRKASNRLVTDGRAVHIDFTRDDAEIQQLLPEIERVHVDRDHSTGRASDLDDAESLHLWRRLIQACAADGRIEVATLTIDSELAAYVIALPDGRSYRVFDGHFDSSYSRYSPGRLLESTVVDRALADGRYTELDWGSGIASEKLLTFNAFEARTRLQAGSLVPAPRRPEAVAVEV
ncbi:MAG: GNAT family N-acetyltransferase [Kineosporiaceae bacterium]|nr:GNAT family N-acetyltransferase [Kineosporiaceae bacterium]MBK8074825.1 GNAT family N-acetyltransferase [Kineosporiaceae bacterium]